MKKKDNPQVMFLPRYSNETPQFVEIKTNVPIPKDIYYYCGKPYIVGVALRWDDKTRLFSQDLIEIESKMSFHIHSFYNDICYLCGHHKGEL